MRVTLRDIASAAGVSMMTVSNVVNGNHARVSPATVAKVRRIVDELGYVPSASARSLAARASHLVGLLVPAADEDSLTLSPHNTAILGQVERSLRKSGYHLLLRGIADPAEIPEALRSWSLDGAILLGFLDEEIDRLGAVELGRVPVLAIDSYSDNPLTTGVRSDDFTGARLATAHLIGLGHREILFAGPAFGDAGVVAERRRGFLAAFADAGLSRSDGLVATVNTTHEDGLALGGHLLERFPSATAVFATADILAIGVMAGLAEAGVPVPARLSVVGFDDLDLSAYVTPKLTTVAQDMTAKADNAVTLLLAEVKDERRPESPLTLPVRLVERDSTAPASRSPW
ncbi:LacI family DNA-binding transcriptional regulator [Actinophytocola sp.]|uniref:LacI family DNA-binding transcriptional regulator n=1 Tax=Actinophytocola sp. TaxID=1872138 RepID=UPI002D3327BD|nr:LacI family DNA-binding transcriptional regulator [Actinophytocola sp.]HYQ66353.1 LacI family DNA-binding transcriptional regulator [Actinophytocola sp.]